MASLLQSPDGLAKKLRKVYHDCEESFLDYCSKYKKQCLIIIALFIASTVIGVVYTFCIRDHDMFFLNMLAAWGVFIAIIFTGYFIRAVHKKDKWLLVLTVLPLAFFIYVGIFSGTWSDAAVSALTGVGATFLGLFGVFAGYVIIFYNDLVNKLEAKLEFERKGKIEKAKIEMDNARKEKMKTLRYIVGIFWCLCLSLLLSFISLNYLALKQSGNDFVGEISGGHPYRVLFFAVLCLYYGLLGTLYLILQFSVKNKTVGYELNSKPVLSSEPDYSICSPLPLMITLSSESELKSESNSQEIGEEER